MTLQRQERLVRFGESSASDRSAGSTLRHEAKSIPCDMKPDAMNTRQQRDGLVFVALRKKIGKRVEYAGLDFLHCSVNSIGQPPNKVASVMP